MSSSAHLIINLSISVLSVIGIVIFLWRWLKGSRDPAMLMFRWLLTVAAAYGIWSTGRFMSKAIDEGSNAAALGVFYLLFLGLFLAFVWVPAIVGGIGARIGSMFDGGNVEVEPKPFYSIFQASRAKGNFYEALKEIRRQLDKFPTDFEGQMLLASLQAENLDDLPGAEVTVERLCAQPGHSPVNIAYAFNQLADWHLKITKDRDSAKAALERISELLPDTEQALQAAQRIAHLAGTEALLAPWSRQRAVLKPGVHNVGLLREEEKLKIVEEDPGQQAAAYVKHLETHPLDSEAREKLAVLYAKHFHRLDLGLDQLEQLVRQPNQPARNVIHWLNLMADLQIEGGASQETVRATLQRILELYPSHASADTTKRRLDLLRNEMRPKEAAHSVRLGKYEQNLGLKRGT